MGVITILSSVEDDVLRDLLNNIHFSIACHSGTDRDFNNRADWREQVAEWPRLVQVDSQAMSRNPHAFSDGQRQRIIIAHAHAPMIACERVNWLYDRYRRFMMFLQLLKDERIEPLRSFSLRLSSCKLRGLPSCDGIELLKSKTPKSKRRRSVSSVPPSPGGPKRFQHYPDFRFRCVLATFAHERVSVTGTVVYSLC